MMKTEDELHRAAAIVSLFASGEMGEPDTPASEASMKAMASMFCWILHGDCRNAKQVDRLLDRLESEARAAGYGTVKSPSHPDNLAARRGRPIQ